MKHIVIVMLLIALLGKITQSIPESVTEPGPFKRAPCQCLMITCSPLVAASLTVISVKAVSGMIKESVKGYMQLTYPIFYVKIGRASCRDRV